MLLEKILKRKTKKGIESLENAGNIISLWLVIVEVLVYSRILHTPVLTGYTGT